MSGITVMGILAMAVSLVGYYALFSDWVGAWCAPLLTHCAIIVLMMLGGMAGLLAPVWWALLAGGLACFARAIIAGRARLPWGAIAAMTVGAAYAWIHYAGTYFANNDSAAHWALVVKYLARMGRFPDAGARMIYFPSYPLGTGVFIHYVCRVAGIAPGSMLAAQFMLCWSATLPMLGFVKGNRILGHAFCGAAMVMMIAMNLYHYSLQVDALLGYMTLGGSCAVWLNRDRPVRALAVAAAVAVALTFIKASGAAMALLLIGLAATGRDGSRPGARQVVAALLTVAVAFGLWRLHVRLAFGDVAGKQAVSLRRYMSLLRDKDAGMIARVAVSMLRELFSPDIHMFTLPLFCAALALSLFGGLDRRLWLRRLRRTTVFAAAVFLVWYAMLFLTYVFSMTSGEADRLASLQRYRLTGVIYVAGVMAVFILDYLSLMRIQAAPARQWAIAGAGATLFCAMALVPVGNGSMAARLLDRSRDGRAEYAYVLDLRARNDVEEGKRYIAFAEYDRAHRMRSQHETKYEFFSNDLMMIYGDYLDPDTGEKGYLALKNYYIDRGDAERVTDLEQVLAESVGEYDYVLVYARDDAFEVALDAVIERIHPAARVCYSYRD